MNRFLLSLLAFFSVSFFVKQSNAEDKKESEIEQIKRMQQIESSMQNSAPRKVGILTESGTNIRPYGRIFIRTTIDNSNNEADAEAYVNRPQEGSIKKRNTFDLESTGSRIGFNFDFPDAFNGKIFGKIELDMGGGNTNSSSGTSTLAKLRYSYVRWKQDTWKLLVGQLDVPMSTFSEDAICRAGISGSPMGGRRPQVTISKKFRDVFSDKNNFTARVGIVKKQVDSDFGETQTSPHFQGALVYKRPSHVEGEQSAFSVAGSIGSNLYEGDSAGSIKGKRFKSWIYAFTAKFPIAKWLVFTGQIGHSFGHGWSTFSGINLTKADIVRAHFGLAQLTFLPPDIKGLQINLGMGLDKPTGKYLSLGNPKAEINRNVSFFTNCVYKLAKNINVGLEYGYTRTKYIQNNLGGGYIHRFTGALGYSF